MLSLLLDTEYGRDLGFACEHPFKNRLKLSFKRKNKVRRKTNFGLPIKGLHCRARMGRDCAAPLLQVSHVIMDQLQQPLLQHSIDSHRALQVPTHSFTLQIHTGLSRCPHIPSWLKELMDSTVLVIRKYNSLQKVPSWG